MNTTSDPVRVLYSFPHKLGAERICNTAWQLVNGVSSAGADLIVFPGVLQRQLPDPVKVFPTLAKGRFRILYKLLGRVRALALHDLIVARRLERLAGQIDIVHAWPVGALRTLRAALRLGIPTVLERPNAHTRFAYEIVRQECDRVGVTMPRGHEHTYNDRVLAIEEREYRLATRLLCPSDFVAASFRQRGFEPGRLARHQYGYDPSVYYPGNEPRSQPRGLSVLFVGGCAPRKGVHYALEAWLQSPAHRDGTFRIVGEFIPGYAEKLATQLAHPSVQVLGHRQDVAELMREADVLILPSIEEGSALVTAEARGSGCVLLVSDAAGAICAHMENALVHRARDVRSLTEHLTLLHSDRSMLDRLRSASLSTVDRITWAAAGRRLLEAYRETIDMHRRDRQSVTRLTA